MATRATIYIWSEEETRADETCENDTSVFARLSRAMSKGAVPRFHMMSDGYPERVLPIIMRHYETRNLVPSEVDTWVELEMLSDKMKQAIGDHDTKYPVIRSQDYAVNIDCDFQYHVVLSHGAVISVGPYPAMRTQEKK